MDLLKLGSNSLVNVQQALNTTGHNVSNANTEGYSRQRINFAARQSEQFGFGSVGQGAYITGIERFSDRFMTAQVQNFSSSESRYRAYLDYSARLDELMADSNHSLNSSMQQFWNGVQGVSNNPAATPERQVMLSAANELVSRFGAIEKSLNSLNDEIDSQLKTTISEINGLTNSIRQVNLQIVSASVSNTAAAPNDLLDQRDRLLTKLSEKVGISVVPQNDGSINVFAGKGQALVIGTEVSPLALRTDPDNGNKLEVTFANDAGKNVISQFLQGGELQGLLEFRDQNMAQTQSRLGLMAMTLSSEFNAQHQKGLDLQSAKGGLFFAPSTFNVAGNSSNQGSASINASVVDVKAVRASDYRVKYDGSVWHLTRMSDGTEVSGVGALTIDGLTVNTSGAPAAGDSFTFNPAQDAAAHFAVQIKDPRLIAAAAAIKGTAASGNRGAALVEQMQVTNAASMPLSAPLILSFDANALGAGVPGFVMSGAATGTLAYDPATESAGKDFALSGLGISFRISGAPQAGDALSITNNAGAKGDNRNALALADLQGSKFVNGQQDTLQRFYAALVSDVGLNQQQATSNHEVQTTLLSQAREYRDSVSGVNLDEEAANMLRFQQAYQASAQMIKIADTVFQTLMNSIGR